MPDGRPRRLGRYVVDERLGKGGMAETFRVRLDGPRGFVQRFAAKRVLPEHAGDARLGRMLADEARITARLRHPGIVQVFELVDDGGELFLVMELVDGVDLATLLGAAARERLPMPLGAACQIALALLGALAYAHALTDDDGAPLGIVHRDVSPSNVMIARTGDVKLLDFGVARAAESLRSERTRTGARELKGKLGYFSPEQATGAALDGRSDQFAVGIVLWECLSGRRLFRAGDDLQTLRLIEEARAPAPSTLRADVGAELDAFVARLLARDPAARFADCGAAADALGPIARRLGAGPGALVDFVADTRALEPPDRRDPTASTEEQHPSASPRRRAWPLALAAVATLAVATALLWPRPPARPVAPPPQPAPAPAPEVTAPAAIRLHVDGTPDAELLLDGVRLGTIPYDAPLPRATTPRLLVARRPGFRPERRTITPDHDLTLDLRLRPAPAAAPDPDDVPDPFR